MIIYKVTIGTTTTEFPSQAAAEAFCLQNNVGFETIEQETRESTVDVIALIDAALLQKQSVAMPLLREVFAKNTAEGITTEQSSQLFRDHFDIILCILVGAFPTAYAMLSTVQPSGFLTQERLDAWKDTLAKYL